MLHVALSALIGVNWARFQSLYILSLPPVMHEAFELIRLVDKLPLKICTLATWGKGGKEKFQLPLWGALYRREQICSCNPIAYLPRQCLFGVVVLTNGPVLCR